MNNIDVLMHPVRLKISLALIRHKETGLTPLEMVKVIKDVPQATLYRHIQIMADADVIHVIKEKKVKSVTEKYYALNEAEAKFDENTWGKVPVKAKLDYISYYQLLLFSKYQDYLEKLQKQNSTEDGSTFSIVELNLNDEHFMQFQKELNELIQKYYNATNNEKHTPSRTVAITIIPES